MPGSNTELLSGSRSWNVANIKALSNNTELVKQVPIDSLSPESLFTLVQTHVVHEGLPLVISGLHNSQKWNGDIFTPEWLAENYIPESEIPFLLAPPMILYQSTGCILAIPIRDVLNGQDLGASVKFYIREIIYHAAGELVKSDACTRPS